jgi:uncharacterized protein YggE
MNRFKRVLIVSSLIAICAVRVTSQEAGNRNYGRPAQRPTVDTSTILANDDQIIPAYVMINVPPDEFIAVFGASQVAATAGESNTKVNAQIEQLLSAAERLGITRSNTFVDFITQNRVYSFSSPSEGAIRETLSGFETKKTISLRYKDRPLLEKLLTAAAQASIYDLIKVDYVITDLSKVRARLFEEATRVVKQKEENYTRALGLTIRRYGLLQENYETFYPAELYQTYAAFESGTVDNNYQSTTRVIRERKSSTSYLEPLDRSKFDSVLNGASIEPMIQCTLFMRVAYSLAK